ncbi:MAG: sugar phosphate isomerase/epimerase family protein [Opitutales bacterium]
MPDFLDRLSLSTCWCSGRHTDGYAMAEEMAALGFKRIELSHGIRISLVPGILQALEDGVIAVSSIHNFCPLPNSVQHAAPNLFQPSSLDPRERELWQRYTRQTIDFAGKVGAQHVVMHSGSVSFLLLPPRRGLRRWIEGSDLGREALGKDPEFAQWRERAVRRIRRASQKRLPHVWACYDAVLPMAEERGVRLCVENREGLEELPMDADFPVFLEKMQKSDSAGFWHDTGHARVKEQLGLLEHRAHLEAVAPLLSGFHLHDVDEKGEDHKVPGRGNIDFKMVASFFEPHHQLVLELNPGLSSDDVRAARDYIGGLVG